ncbi:MAG: hypothetical protein H7X80_01285 [bacterium]|nr:hypothetical protein [Candidatus Kapabacteria bacterium]
MSKDKARSEAECNDSEQASGGFGASVLTTVAAFAGTIVGNGLRLFVKAKADNAERESQGLPADSEQPLTLTGVISNTVAAAAIAHALPNRRPLIAFAIGVGLTAATGDLPDRAIMDRFKGEPDGFVPMEEEEDPDGV